MYDLDTFGVVSSPGTVAEVLMALAFHGLTVRLTNRHRGMCVLLSRGLLLKEVAAALNLTYGTAKVYSSQMRTKGITHADQVAVGLALRFAGWVPPAAPRWDPARIIVPEGLYESSLLAAVLTAALPEPA